MSIKRDALSLLKYPLKIINCTSKFMLLNRSYRLRVLLYHDIACSEAKSFEKQLYFLSQKWQFLSPSEFASVLLGKETLKKDSVLLTFDDGFISNYFVAKQVLDKFNIKALFFVVSEYVNISSEDDWRSFVCRNIYPGMNAIEVPDQWRNMTISHLKDLISAGHTIGAHTATHARLSSIKTSRDLKYEIIESANRLEGQLGMPIEHFAYTFGDIASFSPEALKVAKSRFNFIYTGLGGNNAVHMNPKMIKRDAIFPQDSLSLVEALTEGAGDLFFRKSLKKLINWAQV